MNILKSIILGAILVFVGVFLLRNLLAMPDPSSAYCAENGGETGQALDNGWICYFPDGSECATWPYFHGECEPGMYMNWVDEMESKNHILYFWTTESGFKYFESDPPLLSMAETMKKAPYIEKGKANFTYHKIAIQSRNRFAQDDRSSTSTLQVLMDNVVVDSIEIPGLAYYDSTAVYVNIPVPSENEGRYTMFLQTSGTDESNAWHGEELIDFEGEYWNRKTTTTAETSDETRPKTGIFKRIASFLKNLFS